MVFSPGADGTDDTEGSVASGHNLLLVLNTLLGKVEGKEVLEEEGNHVDFHGSGLALFLVKQMLRYNSLTALTYRLSSLLAEQIDHLLSVLGPDIAVLLEELLALLNGHESEGLEGLGGAFDGGVDILLRSNGNRPELLASGRVNTVVLVLGVDLLAGDGVGEGVPLDRHFGCVVSDSEGYGGGCVEREEEVA